MSETIIRDLRGRLVYNSRGEETIEVDVIVGKSLGRAAAPAGKSKGGKEVVYYPKDSVREAVRIVNEELSSRLKGVDASDIKNFEEVLKKYDDSKNLSKIGGNTVYALSLATSLAVSSSLGIPLYKYLKIVDDFYLPLPLGNVIGGGRHAGRGAPDWQELLTIPLGAPDIYSAIRANFIVHEYTGKLLDKVLGGFTLGKGDEGAYAPPIRTEKGLEVLREAIDYVSDELGFKIGLGVDVAASSLWDSKRRMYVYSNEGKMLTRREQIDRVIDWVERFNIVYVEDPLEEDDMDGFAELNKQLSGKALICGDDLIVTNPEILKEAIVKKAVSALIVKPNQVGFLTTAMETVKIAHKEKIIPVVSHRSGEPPEGYLAHLAIAWGGKVLKAGIMGGERVAKANELIRVGEEIGVNKVMRM
ncbi:MAG: phosphopyruvate hydratase [Nitrososphaeria archaeon]|nr:phosphopyruvate hydratase [Nitrososphaeria archaeon]